MKLLMTPKFHCLLRHAVSQLKATGGGLCDLGEDGNERSHQERLKDNRPSADLKNFRHRTDSQTKMRHIRQMAEIETSQEKVAIASTTILKRERPLAEERKGTGSPGGRRHGREELKKLETHPVPSPRLLLGSLTCQIYPKARRSSVISHRLGNINDHNRYCEQSKLLV